MLAAHLDGVGPGAASAGSLRHPLPQVGVRLHREAEVGLLDVHAEESSRSYSANHRQVLSALTNQRQVSSIVSTSQSKTSIVINSQ